MRAAPHREDKLVVPCKVDRRNHVGDAGAAHDERGPPVDVAVPDAPRPLVVLVTGLNEPAAQRAAQFVHDSIAQGCAGAVESCHLYPNHRFLLFLPAYRVGRAAPRPSVGE
jgi:hypothetical protein